MNFLQTVRKYSIICFTEAIKMLLSTLVSLYITEYTAIDSVKTTQIINLDSNLFFICTSNDPSNAETTNGLFSFIMLLASIYLCFTLLFLVVIWQIEGYFGEQILPWARKKYYDLYYNEFQPQILKGRKFYEENMVLDNDAKYKFSLLSRALRCFSTSYKNIELIVPQNINRPKIKSKGYIKTLKEIDVNCIYNDICLSIETLYKIKAEINRMESLEFTWGNPDDYKNPLENLNDNCDDLIRKYMYIITRLNKILQTEKIITTG